MNIITSTEALRDLCAQFAERSYVAVDTEFMRDKTYWSKLCLVQLAAPDLEAIVDPLGDIDLTPLHDLLADTSVTKVMHAARQDVEIFYHGGNVIPSPLFDTQIAAMVCGFGDSISYDNLVRRVLGENIDKSSRFTDWARRPLSEKQLDYALGDVTHLCRVYETLHSKLDRSGRSDWLQEELSVLTSRDTYEIVPDRSWERVKAKPKSKRGLAVLVDVAAWREMEAQRQDVPRNRVMKDEGLVEIATHAPQSPEELSALRSIPRGFERSRSATSLLEAVTRGRARSPDTLALPASRETLPGRLEPMVDLLRVLLRMQANKHKVAHRLIANTDDLERIALDDKAPVRALVGWRRELFGAQALDLKHGRMAIAIRKGRAALIPVGQHSDESVDAAE